MKPGARIVLGPRASGAAGFVFLLGLYFFLTASTLSLLGSF